MFRVNRGSLCSSSNRTSFEVSLLWRIHGEGRGGLREFKPPPLSFLVFFVFLFFTNVNMAIQRLVYWVYIRSILRLGSLLFLVQSTVYIYLQYIHVRIHLLVHFIYKLSVLQPWSLLLNAWTFQTVCIHLTIKLDVTFFLIDWLNFMNDYESMQFTFS